MWNAPWDLVYALNVGLTVISWFEHLPQNEQPPRHLWWSEELLDEWFQEVRDRRDSKYGGSRGRTSYDEARDAPMSENELAAEYRRAMNG